MSFMKTRGILGKQYFEFPFAFILAERCAIHVTYFAAGTEQSPKEKEKIQTHPMLPSYSVISV